MKSYFLLFIALWLLLSQCRKKAEPEPLTRLPPATQIGANTFGCLVNGQAMLPQGYDGTANYDVMYDATFQGGNLDVRAYQITKHSRRRYLIVGGSGIDKPGVYTLGAAEAKLAYVTDENQPPQCVTYSSDNPGTSCQGTLTVSRLDLTAGIVAGTFAFTLARPGCDTLRVTEGRFDSKL